jgi:hypothetical protein
MGLCGTALASPVPPTVKVFQIERVLVLPALVSTIKPNPQVVTPAILAALAAGQLEIRERLSYDPLGHTVASTTFLVPAGSPIPTPASTDLSKQTIAFFVVSVGEPVLSTQPYPSVLFTGTVVSNPNGTPFGNYLGAAAEISAGYTIDTPPKLNNVSCVIAGATVAYSPNAVGTLTISQASIKAVPNPISTNGAAGVTTISWNAPNAKVIEIHLGSPSGPLFVHSGNNGVAKTGPWVTDGLTFYLQDVSDGKPLTADNTLDSVVVHLKKM